MTESTAEIVMGPRTRPLHDPAVAVLIPVRNESDAIMRCLDAVLDQDLPRDEVEVIVVDGASSDGTAEIAIRHLANQGFAKVQVLNNPEGTTPSNLNRGLEAISAPIVCRVDAHSMIPPSYLRQCRAHLDEHPTTKVAGGAQRAVAHDDSARAIGIARALNNHWGMGLSAYRRGAAGGPADTVYLGAFRTEELRSIGGWNEQLRTNQDFDLNRRLGRIGQVWLLADTSVAYLPRRSLSSLFHQYRRFGDWKVRYWRMTGQRPRPRQWVLLLIPPITLLGTAVGATRLSMKQVAYVLPISTLVAFAVDHFGCREPNGGLFARCYAVAALALVAFGWTGGIWFRLLMREPPPE